MQVHGVQRPHSTGTERSVRRGYANGVEDEGQANRKEEKGQWLSTNLISCKALFYLI